MAKSREEILKEIVKKGKENPKGWKATHCYNSQLNILERYILNPKVGIYQINEWYKNPFEVKGIGDKIAKKVDEDLLDEKIGSFGIIKFEPRKIIENMESGMLVEDIFRKAYAGKEGSGIDIALKGGVHAPNKIYEMCKEKQNELNEEFKKFLERERAFEGYA